MNKVSKKQAQKNMQPSQDQQQQKINLLYEANLRRKISQSINVVATSFAIVYMFLINP